MTAIQSICCLVMLGGLASFGAGAAPSASDATSDAPKVEQLAKKADEKLQCKMERAVGTNRMKRVCTTAAQRDAENEAARQVMDINSRCVGAECIGS